MKSERGSTTLMVLGIVAVLSIAFVLYSSQTEVVKQDYNRIKVADQGQSLEFNLRQMLTTPAFIANSFNQRTENKTLYDNCINPTPTPVPTPPYSPNFFLLVVPPSTEIVSGGSPVALDETNKPLNTVVKYLNSPGYDAVGNHCDLYNAPSDDCVIQSLLWVSNCDNSGNFEFSYSIVFSASGMPDPNPFSPTAKKYTMPPLTQAPYVKYLITKDTNGVFSALSPHVIPSDTPMPTAMPQ